MSATSDGTIFIEDLSVDCVIGVHDFERGSRQRLLISLELDLDISAAAVSDALEDTFDYARLAEDVMGIARRGRFKLLESLADALAQQLLAPPVEAIRITIRKPGAQRNAHSVGVRIERHRQNLDQQT